MLTALLIAVLIVAGAATAVGGVLVWAAQRRHELEGGGAPKRLTAGAGAAELERTVRDLRTGDVIQHDGKDFLVEAVLSYDEDGHRWLAGRLVDGGDERWLVVGMERVGSASMRLCLVDGEVAMSGYPPEAIATAGKRYQLEKRGTATVKLAGEAGFSPGPRGEAPESVLRCRWWRYEAAGTDCLIVEQWGSEFRVLRGATVGDGDLEMMPGS